MKSFCNKCNLNSEIENQRLMLNNLISKKGCNLLDKEIVTLSQTLDNLVYKCVLCDKNLVDLNKINLKNIFGTHSTLYYYGKQHLFVNMYFYITEGIKNNEIVYISMQESLYEKLMSFLESYGILTENIKFRPVKELILSNKEGGLTKLKEKVNNVLSEDDTKKYSGIRWIGQPSYAIKTTSEKDFLDWEINLSEAMKNTKASLICIYDAFDCMHKGIFINGNVMDKSLNTHSHILKNLVLEEI
ncbi:MAG: MEDS domain-containing protein [Bacillota bacterium]|nr:MEDS domain-containing protein [Bacillota bacterium]